MILILSREDFRILMSLADDFNKAVTDNTAAVTALATAVANLPPASGGSVSDATVQAGVVQLAANTQSVADSIAKLPSATPPPAPSFIKP